MSARRDLARADSASAPRCVPGVEHVGARECVGDFATGVVAAALLLAGFLVFRWGWRRAT